MARAARQMKAGRCLDCLGCGLWWVGRRKRWRLADEDVWSNSGHIFSACKARASNPDLDYWEMRRLVLQILHLVVDWWVLLVVDVGLVVEKLVGKVIGKVVGRVVEWVVMHHLSLHTRPYLTGKSREAAGTGRGKAEQEELERQRKWVGPEVWMDPRRGMVVDDWKDPS